MRFPGRPWRRPIRSGPAQNALDLGDRGPVDSGDLGGCHAVFDPAADSGILRTRDNTPRPPTRPTARWRRGRFARRRLRRDDRQHPRLAHRFFGCRRGCRGRWLRRRRLCHEQRFSGRPRPGDPLALGIRRIWLSPPAEQASLQNARPMRNIKVDSLILASGSWLCGSESRCPTGAAGIRLEVMRLRSVEPLA
jgi:hypothetical protein